MTNSKQILIDVVINDGTNNSKILDIDASLKETIAYNIKHAEEIFIKNKRSLNEILNKYKMAEIDRQEIIEIFNNAISEIYHKAMADYDTKMGAEIEDMLNNIFSNVKHTDMNVKFIDD